MSDTIGNLIALRIQWTHEMTLAVTEDLTDEQLAQQPSPTAPPIGWHLWHVARWADRLQASFPSNMTESGRELDHRSQIWMGEGLAARWRLNPETLGVLEAGSGMEVDVAVSLAQVGKGVLLDYARRAFTDVEQLTADLDVSQLTASRKSVMEFRIDGDSVSEALGEETTVVADLGFHLAHANRHLGMIESLRGSMLGMRGTASV